LPQAGHSLQRGPDGVEMIPITDTGSAVTAKYQIERVLLQQDRWRLAIGDGAQTIIEESGEETGYELRIAWGKLIFSWWDHTHAQSWRLTAYDISNGNVRMQGVRGVAQAATRLTLTEAGVSNDETEYEERLRHALLSSGYRIRGMRKAGGFFKLVLERKHRLELLIAIDDTQPQARIDSALGAGIRWLSAFNRRRPLDRRAPRISICTPSTRSLTLRQRLGLLSTEHLGARIACLELDVNTGSMTSMPTATQEELLQTFPGRLSWPKTRASSAAWHERICALAPGLIEVRPLARGQGQRYLVHGLEFACETGRLAWFGVSDGKTIPETRLTPESFGVLSGMVRDLVRYRRSRPPDRRHPFYVLRPEAWLESLLRRDVSALDSSLDGRHVYAQIPTWRGRERSIIDLLTVNRFGRLVVIEIKAVAEPELPMQGLDYWLRIEQARRRGDFKRRRLFEGVDLADATPLLFLVAPVLSFHRSFRTVAGCLSGNVEAYRIGINGGWRARIRVELKERVHPAT
jgi:hypothetical protein